VRKGKKKGKPRLRVMTSGLKDRHFSENEALQGREEKMLNFEKEGSGGGGKEAADDYRDLGRPKGRKGRVLETRRICW